MKTEHTPGPWQVRSKQAHHLHQVGIVKHGNFRAIADTCGENATANARLIAAAPELLEACKAALAFGLDDHKDGEQALYAQMGAAIAKAANMERKTI